MDICLEEDDGVVLDLLDEDNINVLSYLTDAYYGDGGLFTSYFAFFQMLGITDTQFIHSAMTNLARESKNGIDKDSIIKDLDERSKIKLDVYHYATLSNIYVRFLIFDCTLDKKEQITTEDIDFLFDSTDDIKARIGELCMEILLNSNQQKQIQETKIHSLGGKSRAKKYAQYRNEILSAWQNSGCHSYALFARKHADKYNLSTKTIENWLSKKFSNQK